MNDKQLNEFLIAADKPSLVIFGSATCGPCKNALSAALELEKSLGVNVVYLDIRDVPDTIETYFITTVPTLVLFKGSLPVGAKIGIAAKYQIEEFVREVLG